MTGMLNLSVFTVGIYADNLQVLSFKTQMHMCICNCVNIPYLLKYEIFFFRFII